jgi:carbon storage regulator
MLVLTRNVGDSIIIDNDIRIYICAIQGKQVRIGIHAPPEIEINRSEIQERKDREKELLKRTQF